MRKYFCILSLSFILFSGCNAEVQNKPADTASAEIQESTEVKTSEIPTETTATTSAVTSVEPTESEEDFVYNDAFLIKVENTDIFKEAGERYFYIGRKTCPTCRDWLPILEEASVANNKEVYYLDTDIWRDKEDGKEVITNLEIKSVPTLVKMKDGQLVEKLVVKDEFEEAAAKTELQEFYTK